MPQFSSAPVPIGSYPKKMNGKEEEIYNILYEKKEIDDKTPNLRIPTDNNVIPFSPPIHDNT